MIRPHGPKGHWLKGSIEALRADPVQFMSENCEKYPDINHFRAFHFHFYGVSNPDMIQHVLQTNYKSYHKGKQYKQLQIVLGDGLLTSEGDFWRRQRRLAQPAFHRDKIESFIQIMNKYTDQLLKDWEKENGKEIDILEQMMKLTLEIVSDCMFSSDVDAVYGDVKKSMNVILYQTQKRIENVFNVPYPLPSKQNNLLRKNKKILSDIVHNIIHKRFENKAASEKSDLLDMFLKAKDEDTGETMNEKQIHDEVMTVFLAGHETTANALTWGLYLLSKEPEVVQKMREEIEQVLGTEKEIKMMQIPQLKYVTMAAKEILRLYPPAWIVTRECIQEDEIGGYKIPVGSNMMISIFQMHRSEKFWDKPNNFIPERFEDEKNISKFVYFPFGGGPRICIGNTFALTELQVILAKIIPAFSFKYLAKEEPKYVPQITLRPLNGLPLEIEVRR